VKTLVTEDCEAVVRCLQDVRCMEGRNGDNILCPFQCHLCHFRNIKKRDLFARNLKDLNLVCGIGRANLDALWARRPGAVKSNLTLVLRIVKVQEEAHGIPKGQMFRPQGPHPVEDKFGMMTAVVLLDHSYAGFNAATVQFSTIHKTQLAVSNYERTTALDMRKRKVNWECKLSRYVEHPTFTFHNDMKDQLRSMLSKDFKDIKYALLPRTVSYKRGSDGMTHVRRMNGIAIQVANNVDISASDCRAAKQDKYTAHSLRESNYNNKELESPLTYRS
jgi:RNAse (barnase) inhibitor barstar